MTPRSFAVTYDYRCPFARNGHEHVLAGLAGGADWEVTFVPLSLSQLHREEGDTPVWDEPATDSGLWALQASVVVRDRYPQHFAAVHHALFALRHDRSLALDGPNVTAVVATVAGDEIAGAVATAVEEGEALAVVRKEHEAAFDGPGAWGVPTFITSDERAVFVRLMHRNAGLTAAEHADGRATIERVLDLLDWTDLNEFKATRLPK